jgi:cell wall-associated NlpC family hydrolase
MTSPRHTRALLAVAAAVIAASACASAPPQIRVLPPRPAAGPDAAAPAGTAVRATPAGTAAASAIAHTAGTLLGSPYREGGAMPDGFDCSGLVTYVFARHGIAVPRDVLRQAAAGVEVGRADVVPGDLVFFATTGSGPTHVGIAVGGDRFIHAPKSGDVVRVDSMSVSYWASRFVIARRLSWPPGASGT